MRSNGVCVDTEQRNRNECTVAAQTQDSIAQFERCVVLVGVPLVEVDVYFIIEHLFSAQS